MHTGYIPPKVLRLRRSEIDGACNDKRYPEDFFIDLVFDECSADVAGKLLVTASSDNTGIVSKQAEGVDESKNDASSRRMMGTFASSDGAVTLTASAYDSMLHRDSRFWDVIAKRRNDKSKVANSQGEGEEKVSSFYGPLIGRRREFANERVSTTDRDINSVDQATVRSGINSFTIGEELDFTTEKDSQLSQVAREEEHGLGELNIKKEKDDLMEALMALDEEEEEEEEESDNNFLDQSNAQNNAHYSSEHLETELEEIVFAEDMSTDVVTSDGNENNIQISKEEEKKHPNYVKVNVQGTMDQSEDNYDGEEEELDDSELQDLEDFLLKVSI